MKKKMLSMLLAMTCVAGALAGCGQQAETKTDEAAAGAEAKQDSEAAVEEALENMEIEPAVESEVEEGEVDNAQQHLSVYSDPVRLSDYLFEITYESYENARTFAEDYYAENYKLGACSSVQNGDIRGRNYDWVYDNASTFVIHVPATDDRHASVGVAAASLMTPEKVMEGNFDVFMDMLPYGMLDGINDAGLCVNVNVIPFGELGEFEMKTEDPSDDVFPVMVTRLLLDGAGTVEEAINMMEKMDIYSIKDMDEAHFMISGIASADDGTYKTVIVELVPDENKHYQLNVIDKFVDDKPIMTNFPLTGFDGTEASLTARPMGIERYNLLNKQFDQGSSVAGMIELMKKVYYTHTYDLYANDFWYSEHIQDDNPVPYSERGEACLNGDLGKAGGYADSIAKMVEKFANRERGSKENSTWHTVHTAVYDTQNLEVSVLSQEGSIAYKFNLSDRIG
ncbi:MAG: carcinine hydrolase/isopenicillin-N N-acyltransferase family protein [Lachnospiraceae bacterium]|nr:carcinine hydrolase/isopenicillin-N N-acyltransferase family protein [Lachnospiraceae bacterium]